MQITFLRISYFSANNTYRLLTLGDQKGVLSSKRGASARGVSLSANRGNQTLTQTLTLKIVYKRVKVWLFVEDCQVY